MAFPQLFGLNRLIIIITICVVDFKKRVARKIRRIILLHLGLVTFQFHFPKIRVVFIFMIFGSGGRVHGPQKTIMLDLGDTKVLRKGHGKYQIMWEQPYFE